jgi:hypothetical protein
MLTHKRSRGGQPDNQNAKTHGFYSRALEEAESLQLDEALGMEGLDSEIALLRLKLRHLVEAYPERIDLQLQAASVIARLVRIRYQISKEQRKSLKEAITKVLTDVAVPLGIGVVKGISIK